MSPVSIFKIHAQVKDVMFELNSLLSSPRPANPQSNRRFRATEHLGGAVLRPITRARLDASARARPPAHVLYAHLRADCIRISGRAAQHDPKPALGVPIQIELGRPVVLGNSQVHAPVVVEVRQSGASLFSATGVASSQVRVALVLDRLALLPWLSNVALQSVTNGGAGAGSGTLSAGDTFSVGADFNPNGGAK